MPDALERLTAALADRYRIEREPRAGRPRPAVGMHHCSVERRREGAPPSAVSASTAAP